jgi:polyhydroxybutyrate depolymerase
MGLAKIGKSAWFCGGATHPCERKVWIRVCVVPKLELSSLRMTEVIDVRKIGTVFAALTTWALAWITAPPSYAAKLTWENVQVEGNERHFLVDRPASFADTDYSVLVILHGFGSDPIEARTEMGFDQLENRDDFLFVFPEGTGPKATELSWNAGFCCRSAMQHGVDDVAFLDRVVDTLAAETRVDRRRVYVTGFSNGALLAYRWGAARAQTVAGIAAVAGAIAGKAGFSEPEVRIAEPQQPVSVLIVHGEKDPFFPYGGGVSQALMSRLPGRASASVADTISFWRRSDGCIGDPKISPANRQGVSLQQFARCRNGTAVEAWTFAQMGHEWPKRLAQPAGGPNKPLFDDYILEFFRNHPKSDQAP